jgi:hypothetical protein
VSATNLVVAVSRSARGLFLRKQCREALLVGGSARPKNATTNGAPRIAKSVSSNLGLLATRPATVAANLEAELSNRKAREEASLAQY